MKKLSVALLALVIALSSASCTMNDTDPYVAPQETLLKKAKLKRDASGAYSVDYVVAENTVSNKRLDASSLTNEIHLSKVNHNTEANLREDFTLDNNKLSIGFIDGESGKYTKLSVEDENIKFAKGESKEFLKTYELSVNEDGTILLDFEVKDNIEVDFQYNDKKEAYEIHLSKGTTNETKFSRTFPKSEDDKPVKLDFVNHHKLYGKGLTAEYTVSKPVIVVDDGTSNSETILSAI
ncbi:MAG: hypothetical protein HWD85_10370 [Flavobacteriaceae bacterium]|nr:hypothetical protein [Flavobacteriaceae bacterium]